MPIATVTLTRPDDSNETVQAILDNLEAQHDLSVKISEATAQMTEETKKGEAALAADWASQAIARRKQLQATIEEGNKAFMKEQELAREHAAAMEKVADAYKDLMDPSREWLRRMAEVDAAHAAGKLSAEEHADSLALLQSQMAEANAVKDFGWFEDDAKKAATGAESAILNFTDSINSAFEESIIQGKELSDVLGDLGRSVMATFLKLSVVNPLMNSLFGGVNGWDMLPSFGGGKAAGGPVSAGTAYMVGERGPELFMPDTAGTIVPNRALGGAAASVVKNFFIDARGADRTGLAQLYSYIRSIDGSIEERAVSAVIDQRRRGAFG